MTTVLIVIWTTLALCLVPLIGASLLAAVWVAIDEPKEYQ